MLILIAKILGVTLLLVAGAAVATIGFVRMIETMAEDEQGGPDTEAQQRMADRKLTKEIEKWRDGK